MNLITAVLRAIRRLPPLRDHADDDQTYSEAVMENAVRESDKGIERLNEAAEKSAQYTARLRAGVDRLATSNGDRPDAMAQLVKGMKSRNGVI